MFEKWRQWRREKVRGRAGGENDEPVQKLYISLVPRALYVDQDMDQCFWTEVSVCHSSLCGLALAISVL